MILLYTVTSTKMAEMTSIFVLHVTFLRGKTMTKLLDSIMMTGLLFFLSPSRNLNNHQTDVPIYCHLNQGQRWNPFVVACDVFKRGNHDWAIRFQVFLIFDNVSHFPDLSKFSSSLSRTLINDLTYACIEVEPKMLRESAFTEPPVSLLHHICTYLVHHRGRRQYRGSQRWQTWGIQLLTGPSFNSKSNSNLIFMGTGHIASRRNMFIIIFSNLLWAFFG